MPDKFSFVLDDKNALKKIKENNTVREMTDLEILGLPNNYFDNNDLHAFKKEARKIYLDTHPDKNKESLHLRATEAFKYVQPAIERININLQENNGKYIPPPANASSDSHEGDFYEDEDDLEERRFPWWQTFLRKAYTARSKLWEEEVLRSESEVNPGPSLEIYNQMTPLEKLQARVQRIHQNSQHLFNKIIDEYLEIAEEWAGKGFNPNIDKIREYGEGYFYEITDFYAYYATLLEQTGSIQSPANAFKSILNSFDRFGIRNPVYNRPNNIPFDLPLFIETLNWQLNQHLGDDLGLSAHNAEKLPKIQFSYTGTNPRVALLCEIKPRNYHQLTVNALVEAHPLLQEWWKRNKESKDWKSVTKEEQEVFKQSDFYKLLETHSILGGYEPEQFFELYRSAFGLIGKDPTDVQKLVNAIKERLKNSTSYRSFDDFSKYTGKNEKVLQLIKEKAEAKQAKIQDPYNKHIEDVYNATKVIHKFTSNIETILKQKAMISFQEAMISFGAISQFHQQEASKAYDKAFKDDGSFDLKAYQQSINSILKKEPAFVYTGKNEAIQDYFHPRHPADFHQVTINALLEAHIKVVPSWDEYGRARISDDEERKQFHQSEFCKVIEKHPILKELSPNEREDLYLSIFDIHRSYHVTAFIQRVKKELLHKGPYFYQSYADFSEYTGFDEEVLKALGMQVARNTVESNPSEIPAMLDVGKSKENIRKRQPTPEVPPRPSAEDKVARRTAPKVPPRTDADKIARQPAPKVPPRTDADKVARQPVPEVPPRDDADKVARQPVPEVPPRADADKVARVSIPEVLSDRASTADTVSNQTIPDDVPIPRIEAEPSPQSAIPQTSRPDSIRSESVSEAKKPKITQNRNLLFSASSTEQEENVPNLQASLQSYINDRNKELYFHYNFLKIVTLIYFFHDKIWGTHYSDIKNKDIKIKTAEKIMNGNFSLNDFEKAAASEGRLGKLLNTFGGLDELTKKASEPPKDDQSLQL